MQTILMRRMKSVLSRSMVSMMLPPQYGMARSVVNGVGAFQGANAPLVVTAGSTTWMARPVYAFPFTGIRNVTGDNKMTVLNKRVPII